MVWQTGQRLQGGKFEIIEILGQGGFGITYKARNRVLDIDVVIKTPNTLQRRDSEYDQYIQQFQEEGRKLARFSANPHPHIVRILDIFLEDQVPCSVMDFIQGQTLMEKVKNQGSLSESECLRYIRQVGDALVTVHQAGFVHRDAHPGNIMIQPNGKAILIDFGIAKNIIPATRSSTNNAANLSFAPYEQIYKGSNASREPNVDVYSLAATFYYAITGKFPTPSMERRLDNRPLIPPQQINRQLSGYINDAIVLGMALEKEDRPQSMSVWLNKFGQISVQVVPDIIANSSQNPIPVKREKLNFGLMIFFFQVFSSFFLLSIGTGHFLGDNKNFFVLIFAGIGPAVLANIAFKGMTLTNLIAMFLNSLVNSYAINYNRIKWNPHLPSGYFNGDIIIGAVIYFILSISFVIKFKEYFSLSRLSLTIFICGYSGIAIGLLGSLFMK